MIKSMPPNGPIPSNIREGLLSIPVFFEHKPFPDDRNMIPSFSHPALDRIQQASVDVDRLEEKRPRLLRRVGAALADAIAVALWRRAGSNKSIDRADALMKKIVLNAGSTTYECSGTAEMLLRKLMELDSICFDDVEEPEQRSIIRSARKALVTRINAAIAASDELTALAKRMRARVETLAARSASPIESSSAGADQCTSTQVSCGQAMEQTSCDDCASASATDDEAACEDSAPACASPVEANEANVDDVHAQVEDVPMEDAPLASDCEDVAVEDAHKPDDEIVEEAPQQPEVKQATSPSWIKVRHVGKTNKQHDHWAESAPSPIQHPFAHVSPVCQPARGRPRQARRPRQQYVQGMPWYNRGTPMQFSSFYPLFGGW